MQEAPAGIAEARTSRSVSLFRSGSGPGWAGAMTLKQLFYIVLEY
jgi:hypothetical protein